MYTEAERDLHSVGLLGPSQQLHDRRDLPGLINKLAAHCLKLEAVHCLSLRMQCETVISRVFEALSQTILFLRLVLLQKAPDRDRSSSSGSITVIHERKFKPIMKINHEIMNTRRKDIIISRIPCHFPFLGSARRARSACTKPHFRVQECVSNTFCYLAGGVYTLCSSFEP